MRRLAVAMLAVGLVLGACGGKSEKDRRTEEVAHALCVNVHRRLGQSTEGC